MKIGLAVYEFKNNDIAFNISQIEKALRQADKSVELLCFGEAFLQGFSALTSQYEKDQEIAIARESVQMKKIMRLTEIYGIDLMLGYIEKDNNDLYSSYVLVENGEITHNYRRMSKGWKDCEKADEHYSEGVRSDTFLYKGYRCKVALCGDLWVMPESFLCEDLLFWPIYVNYTQKQWIEEQEADYATQSAIACAKAVLINSISKEPDAIGGAFYYENGKIMDSLPYGQEGILYIDI